MVSFIDELASLDRPFEPVTIKVGKKSLTFQARKPSGEESDAMEMFFADEHAKALAYLKEAHDGKPCELDTVRSIYASRPDSDLITQLLGTRQSDISKKALELSGINLLKEYVRIQALPKEEQKAAEDENDAKIQSFLPEARKFIEAEYSAHTHEELVEQTTQVAINIKALARANRTLGAQFVYYTLYQPGDNPTRAFESVAQVREKLTPETIDNIVKAIREVLEKDADLPPASPEGNAPDGRSSSPSTSAEGTTASGEHTATTPADSNSSSQPA